MNYEDLQSLNPAYKKGIIPKYTDQVMVRLPTSVKQEQAMAALENSATAVAVAQAVSAAEENEYTRYRIKGGDTLSTISRRFRVSMSHLIEVNDLSRRTILRVGKYLRIPKSQREISSEKKRRPSSMKTKSSKKVVKVNLKRKATKQRVHVVKNGETLINIANRYNVRMSKLISVNNLAKSGRILIGSRLTIPQ
jgi:LysM repeat protein